MLPIHLQECDSLEQFKQLLNMCFVFGNVVLCDALESPRINHLTYFLTY